ncbi:MAG TPA: type IV pilus assembly protein PilM [Myxococcota bacterium]|nr:type IV pilus assembly protein PilM [Myxococcota bacterium]HQP94886.1 type IV pilus assembly protein PilM [Myxococcota bacterium]
MFGQHGSLVGLDIGSSAIKLVRLKQTSGSWALQAFSLGHLPPDAIVDGRIMNFSVVIERLRELMREAGVKGGSCAIAVSGSSLIVKRLSLPEMTRQELADSIVWEAEQYIPFDIKDVNVDAQIINSKAGQGQMDVMMVAAKKDVVNEYVSVAAEAGLTTEVVDVAIFAALNMFEANYTIPADQTIALLNIGSNQINVGIMAGGAIAFTRDISTGGSRLTAEIQRQFNVSWEEAEAFKTGAESSLSSSTIARDVNKLAEKVCDTIVGEIQRSLDFYVATTVNANVNRLYLTGGSAQLPALIRALERRIEVPVELVNPFRNISVDARKFDIDLLQRAAPVAGVCVGLALRRAGDSE